MKLLLLDTTRPNTTFSKPVKSAEVRSEDEKTQHHGKANSAPTTGGLTAPRSGKHFIARSTDDKGGSTPTPAPANLTIDELLVTLGHSDIIKKVKTMEAKHKLLEALEAHKATPGDTTKQDDVRKILKDNKGVLEGDAASGLIPKADYDNFVLDTTIDFSPVPDIFNGKAAAAYKTDILDVETTKLTPIKTNAQKILDRLNREHFDKAGIENIAKANKGLSPWGWAGITALSLIPAGIQWFMGNSAVKAAEEKAKAADDKVTALQEQIQSVLQQLGQVMVSIQQDGKKSTAQLTNLVARLLKLQQKAMTTHSSVASKTVRSSDDNSAGSPTPPPAGDDIKKLEDEVAALEKQQASQPKAPKPATPPESPQGGETSHAGAMPQQLGMPQGGGNQNGGESGMPQQPETQRIRFHRFPEDSRNGGVPVNAFLGDKVITRKVSNTGDRAIIERDDDC